MLLNVITLSHTTTSFRVAAYLAIGVSGSLTPSHRSLELGTVEDEKPSLSSRKPHSIRYMCFSTHYKFPPIPQVVSPA